MASTYPAELVTTPPVGRQNAVAGWIRAHPIAAFLAWFLPVGWTFAFTPVVAERLLGLHLPFEVFLIASTWLGLLLPTVVITRLVDGSTGVRALRHGMLRVRASVGWYALALLAVPALATLLAVLMVGPPNATPTTVLSAIGSGLLLQTAVTFATTQLWEETAWMGFVQVRLQARHGAMLAAVITAGLFTIQHLPLFVENAAGLLVLLAFFALAIPFRALQGWVYNRTASLFLVGLLHAAGDGMAAGSIAGEGFLTRLFPTADTAVLQFGANALLGLVVIVATRARLGVAR
jgi:uncharacterized protein